MNEVIGKGGISAKLIADSRIPIDGTRIATFELTYPRFIHSEFMTHRVFSRNAASSRAIPVRKTIEMVRQGPAKPIHWGANQKGMQADGESESSVWLYHEKGENFYFHEQDEESEHTYYFEKLREYTREEAWEYAAHMAAHVAEKMSEAGYHKQVVNRILEPFQFMKTVMTATEMQNWFHLRDDPDAQPEIRELARAMSQCIQGSEPELLDNGEWHTPYVNHCELPDGEVGYYIDQDGETVSLSLEEALKVSSSCCAQVSFRLLDESLEKAKMIYDKLVNSEPIHCFDSETEVLTDSGFKKWPDVDEKDLLADVDQEKLTFEGFKNPLELVNSRFTGEMYSVDSSSISMRVTEGHRIIGHPVARSESRYSEFDPVIYRAGDKTSERHTKDTMGEVEARIPTSLNVASERDPIGEIIGFYLGDGFRVDNTIGFHLKKQRKIDFIKTALDDAGWCYSIRENKDRTCYIRIYLNDTVKDILTKCGDGSRDKSIGEWSENLYPSIFEGLKNSDGSLKRNTWSYSTSSDNLLSDFLRYAPLAGLTASLNKTQKGCHRVMVQSRQYARINDTRTPDSIVDREYVVNEKVYCATMPSGALVVRRKGKVFISGNSSPFEHQATPMPRVVDFSVDGVTHQDRYGKWWSGNFRQWVQHRQLIKGNAQYG